MLHPRQHGVKTPPAFAPSSPSCLIRCTDGIADVLSGSIVLFRYGDKIIGEAVVSKEKEILDEKIIERIESGEKQVYAAQITFAPSSIRLYSPPLAVEVIKGYAGKDISSAQPYYELDWSIYPVVLREVLKTGTFIS